MTFEPEFSPAPAEAARDHCFAFQGSRLLVHVGAGAPRIPAFADMGVPAHAFSWRQRFGSLDGRGCWAVCLPEDFTRIDGFELKGLRALFGALDEEVVWVAGRAGQLVNWHRSHRYCGRCGQPTEDHRSERAKICPACGLINHPRVSPAVIVAVVRNRRLLLAHAARFPFKFYSVLAGFVEPGEALEECVRREVAEEVGVSVKNIRYFGSQPWPFPDSLMVAFTAEHDAGEIRVDSAEIADAGWFAADALPEVPPKISIARRLIDWFVENHS